MEPVTPSTGWGCLHLFFEAAPDADREAVVAAVKACEEDDHQVVTFAVLGHYEWGGTLFAADPVDLKDCVYQMRFDEASAIYAEFGTFVTGLLGSVEEVLDRVGIS